MTTTTTAPDFRALPRYADLTGAQREAATDYANDTLRAEYWAGVRGVAEDIKDAVDSREIESREALSERVDEEADGSYWVIYTHAALQALRYSDNSDAYAEEFGRGYAEGVVVDGSVLYGKLAYAAFRADLLEHLDALGVGFADGEDEEDEEEGDEAEAE